MLESEIIVRGYKTEDAKDIVESGYPWDTNDWGTWFKDLKLKIISFLERRPRKRFVAFSLNENKAVGTIELDKITKNLWHSGGWFVSPSHRKRGIATLFIKTAQDHLKKIGITKVVSNIEVTNFPSIRTAVKNGGRFIPQSYYRCDGEIRKELGVFEMGGKDRIIFKKIHPPHIGRLFRIYQECVCKEWRTFLEIDKDNFLERFFGYTRMRGLLKLWVRYRVMVLQEKGEIIGYFYYSSPLRKHKRVRVYLFLLSTKKIINFIGKLFNRLRSEGYEQASLIFTNKNRIFMEEVADILQNKFQFKKTKFLISTKFI